MSVNRDKEQTPASGGRCRCHEAAEAWRWCPLPEHDAARPAPPVAESEVGEGWEYAVRCPDGILDTGWSVYSEAAAEAKDRRCSCPGPHEVVRRRVGGWQPAPTTAPAPTTDDEHCRHGMVCCFHGIRCTRPPTTDPAGLRVREPCPLKVAHYPHAWPLVAGVMSTKWCDGIAPTEEKPQ